MTVCRNRWFVLKCWIRHYHVYFLWMIAKVGSLRQQSPILVMCQTQPKPSIISTTMSTWPLSWLRQELTYSALRSVCDHLVNISVNKYTCMWMLLMDRLKTTRWLDMQKEHTERMYQSHYLMTIYKYGTRKLKVKSLTHFILNEVLIYFGQSHVIFRKSIFETTGT